jgi:hypothetical protein
MMVEHENIPEVSLTCRQLPIQLGLTNLSKLYIDLVLF